MTMRSPLLGKQVRITHPRHPKFARVGKVVNSNGLGVCVLLLTSKSQWVRYWLLSSQVEKVDTNNPTIRDC